MAELLLIEEKKNYEEHLRIVLTNSKEMDIVAEKEIADLRARCFEAEEFGKQLQSEVEEYVYKLQTVAEECDAISSDLKSEKEDLTRDKVPDTTDPCQVGSIPVTRPWAVSEYQKNGFEFQ